MNAQNRKISTRDALYQQDEENHFELGVNKWVDFYYEDIVEDHGNS